MGRRGKRRSKQDQRVQRQRRTNEEKRRGELRKRPRLAKRAKAKIDRIAAFCEQGKVVSAHKEGTKPYSPHVFTVDGLVQKLERDWIYDPVQYRAMHKVVGVQVLPWSQMHSRFLRMILRSAWAPLEPKSVLDQMVIATGGFGVEDESE